MHVINNENQFGKDKTSTKETTKNYGQQPSQQTQKGRAQSHGQNIEKASAAPKDAYTLIQEQQRAEQAKQPQNQFDH